MEYEHIDSFCIEKFKRLEATRDWSQLATTALEQKKIYKLKRTVQTNFFFFWGRAIKYADIGDK
jgi:hypothetical protein